MLYLGRKFEPKDNEFKKEMKIIARRTRYRSMKCIIALRIFAICVVLSLAIGIPIAIIILLIKYL